jgi:hypothetical protein
MGLSGGYGAYNAAESFQAGWLNGQYYETGEVVGTRTYTIQPLSKLPHGIRAIKLNDGGQTFWIEYRTKVGNDEHALDAAGTPPSFYPGVVISRIGPATLGFEPRTERLDMRADSARDDATFHVGQVWADPLGSQTVTLLAESPEYATIRISSQLIAVPSILGQTTTQARTTLQNAGLTLGFVEERADPRCESLGRIWTQSPAAGAAVRPGTSISASIGVKEKKRECP